MLEGLSIKEILFVIFAMFVGYGLVTFLIKSVQDKSTGIPEQNGPFQDHAQSDSNSGGQTKEERMESFAWHEVLEISPMATHQEIRDAYRRKISMYHPDKVAGLAPEFAQIAEKKTQDLNRAYEQAIGMEPR